MKLIKHPDGRIELDDVPVELAMKIMANGTGKKPPEPRGTVDIADLNETQLQTWQFLVAHDAEEGVPARDYAAIAGLSESGAAMRLTKLIDLGLAYRVKPGYYRPGQP